MASADKKSLAISFFASEAAKPSGQEKGKNKGRLGPRRIPMFLNSLEHKNCRSCVPMVASATRLRKKKQKKLGFCFVLCSLIRISDSVALDACGAYSSLASLKKILSLERKNKKSWFFVLFFAHLFVSLYPIYGNGPQTAQSGNKYNT